MNFLSIFVLVPLLMMIALFSLKPWSDKFYCSHWSHNITDTFGYSYLPVSH